MILRGEPFDTLGHDLVEVPFIWIPDDYTGPRPGHPWFEAGRMTLSAEQLAAWPACRLTPWGAEALPSDDAANVQRGAGEASAGPQPPGAASADRLGPAPADGPGQAPAAGASERARRYFDQSEGAINAAIKALRGLSDPGAVLRTLDGATASVSAMTSGSAASRRDSSGMGGDRKLYAYVRNDPLNRTDPPGCGGDSSNQLIAGPTIPTTTNPTVSAGSVQLTNVTPTAQAAAPSQSGRQAGVQLAANNPNVITDVSPGDNNVQTVANEGTPGSNQSQNAQVRAVVRILGLTRDQQQQLHLEISGKDYNFQEILQTAKDMFGK